MCIAEFSDWLFRSGLLLIVLGRFEVRRTNRVIVIAACFMMVLLSRNARADTVQFTLTNGGHIIDLTLPMNPTPDFVGPYFFTLNDVAFTLDGSPQLARIINFFDENGGGGIGICDYVNCPVVDLFGPQMFSGGLDAPNMLPGNYVLTDAGDGVIPGDFQTIAAVPEPASLVLASCGAFGLLRRRRN